MGKPLKVTNKSITQLSKKLPQKINHVIMSGHNEILNIPSLHRSLMKDKQYGYTLLDLPIRNYLNIRLVSFVESFLRQQYAELIDNQGFRYNGTLELEFSFLVDLRDSKSKISKFTNGEIVANQHNFQNFDVVNDGKQPVAFRYFSDLTDKDVYAELVKKVGITKVNRWISEIRTLLENRHPVVHTNANTTLSMKTMHGFEADLLGFMFAFNSVVEKFRP